MLIKMPRISSYLKTSNSFSTGCNQKRGTVFIKSTTKNIFCILMDAKDKKVKASSSLRVPNYENEFNERVSLFNRGILLGQLFGDKVAQLGFQEVCIHLDFGVNKGRKGFLKGFGQNKIKVFSIRVVKGCPHNGCRPPKIRRKKTRTKHKG